jgi:hypothetical protein
MSVKKHFLILALFFVPLWAEKAATAVKVKPAIKKVSQIKKKPAKAGKKPTVKKAPSAKKVAKKEVKKVKPKALKLENKIAAVIYTDTTPIVLTQSDFDRLSINGTAQKKQEVILGRLMDHEAQNVYRIPVSDDAVKKYITSLQDHHQIDDARLKEMFKSTGYSYEEGVDELRRMLTIDSLLNFKIKSRLVVPEEEVREQYNNNPQIEPAAYRIKKGFLSSNALSEQERQDLQDTGKNSEYVDWLNPFWLDEDELAASLNVLKTMKEGDIAAPVSVGNGYEIIKLLKKKDRHKRSFEEAYKDIAERLRMPLFEKLLKEYQDELLKKYEIVYL